MTFDANEISTEGGAPVELYDFVLGGETFFLTNAEDETLDAGNTYTPVALTRERITFGPEERSEVISVEMPSDHPFPRKYVNIVPGSLATLTIRRLHRFDTPTPETEIIFKGRVRSVAFDLQGTRAKIAVVPLTAGIGRPVPRFLYSNLCNHVLYDNQCQVVETSFRFTAAISAIVSNVYTIPGVGASVASPTTGGFIQFGAVDFRLVISQSGDDLTLLLPFGSEVGVGTTVDVFAGCAHDIATCNSQFTNTPRYGGFAFVPLRNVFETGLD